MFHVPYTLLDYTRPFCGLPAVSQGFYFVPEYSAERTDRGADAFLDGGHIASFDSMEEACKFITEQSNRSLPWFMRPAAATPNVSGLSHTGVDRG